MIIKRASLAMRLTDGYTGKPLTAAQVRATLDGEPLSCVAKEDGWFIAVDLPDGPHRISLSGAGYLTRAINVEASAGRMAQEHLELMPAPGYPFGRAATWSLTLRRGKKPLADTVFYIRAPERAGAIRIAQDDAVKGSSALRLFAQRKEALLPMPGDYLIGEGSAAEIARIHPPKDGAFPLQSPLAGAHKRGAPLVFTRRHETDGAGKAFVVAEGETLTVYTLGKKGVETFELARGRAGHTEAEVEF